MSYLIIVFNWRHHSNQVICVKDCWRHDQQITMWTTGPDDPICQFASMWRNKTSGMCFNTDTVNEGIWIVHNNQVNVLCNNCQAHLPLNRGATIINVSSGSWGERDIWAYCRSSTHNSIMNSWLATLRAGFGAYGPAWLRPLCPSNAKAVWPTQQYIR